MSAPRPPWVAALLSAAIPGIGQVYNREYGKGITTLCITFGTWIMLALSLAGPPRPGAWISAAMLGLVYLSIWIPAVVDAYQDAAGLPRPWLSGRTAWYIVVLLMTVGPMALPMLWRSPAFSRTAKILWTAAVLLIALLVVGLAALLGPLLEGLLASSP